MTLRAAADLAAHSFPFFLRFVTTKNEVGPDKYRVQRLPMDERPFLGLVATIMQENQTLWVEKSRRMFLTWLCSAELVWQALTPHSHLFVQQTKEDDSDWLVRERCKFIWDHLPEWLRFYAMGGIGTEASYKYCKVGFPNESQVWGIAQGSDQLRKFTATGIFSDEVAIQDQFKDAYTAIAPLAEDGCRVRLVSSARGGTHFAKMVNGDIEPGSIKNPMRGVNHWDLQTGGHVLRLHYTADPQKDPERGGAEWVQRYARSFDGGMEGADWKQEMEIDFLAKSGTKVYQGWNRQRHVIDPLEREFLDNHPEPYWRAIDYGLRNPTACIWVTKHDDEYIVFREFYRADLTPEQIKQGIHALSNDPGYKFTVIDARSDRHDVATQDSAFFLLNAGQYALKAIKANSSEVGRDLVKDWLREGRLKVTSDCVNFIREIESYVHEEWTGTTENKHNLKEQVQKKDDHLMDALKYFANCVRHNEHRNPQVIPLPVSNEYTKRRERIMHPSRAGYAGKSTIMRGYYG